MVRIMIADDNKESAQQLSYLLTKEKNFEIVNVSYDGLEALQNYKELKPDILLLDLDMPKLNGLQLLNIISKYDKRRNVIIISGSDQLRSQISNIDKLVAIYQKPYDIRKIINSIRDIIPDETYDFIELKLDNLLKKLQFDMSAKGTMLLKSSIQESRKMPYLKLDDIMERVRRLNNEKNVRTVHSLIDKQLDSMYNDKKNLEIFCKVFPDFYGEKPTTKYFIKYMLQKIQ